MWGNQVQCIKSNWVYNSLLLWEVQNEQLYLNESKMKGNIRRFRELELNINNKEKNYIHCNRSNLHIYYETITKNFNSNDTIWLSLPCYVGYTENNSAKSSETPTKFDIPNFDRSLIQDNLNDSKNIINFKHQLFLFDNPLISPTFIRSEHNNIETDEESIPKTEPVTPKSEEEFLSPTQIVSEKTSPTQKVTPDMINGFKIVNLNSDTSALEGDSISTSQEYMPKFHIPSVLSSPLETKITNMVASVIHIPTNNNEDILKLNNQNEFPTFQNNEKNNSSDDNPLFSPIVSIPENLTSVVSSPSFSSSSETITMTASYTNDIIYNLPNSLDSPKVKTSLSFPYIYNENIASSKSFSNKTPRKDCLNSENLLDNELLKENSANELDSEVVSDDSEKTLLDLNPKTPEKNFTGYKTRMEEINYAIRNSSNHSLDYDMELLNAESKLETESDISDEEIKNNKTTITQCTIIQTQIDRGLLPLKKSKKIIKKKAEDWQTIRLRY